MRGVTFLGNRQAEIRITTGELAHTGTPQVVLVGLVHGAHVVPAPGLGLLEVVPDELARSLSVQPCRHGVLPRPRFFCGRRIVLPNLSCDSTHQALLST